MVVRRLAERARWGRFTLAKTQNGAGCAVGAIDCAPVHHGSSVGKKRCGAGVESRAAFSY